MGKIQDAKPVGSILKKEITPAVQHGRSDGIGLTKSSYSPDMSKVFTKNAENEKDFVLGVGNDGIWKNGMCMATAFADDSDYTDILVHRLSVDDIDDGSGIRGMSLAVACRMTDWTFLRLRLKRSHEIKK